MKTIWRACGIALLGAFGFGSAYAVAGSATAAIPTTTSVTLPTVSLPTLPTTTTVTVPLPTTTTVTVPPPPTTTTVTVPPLPTTTAVTVPPPPQTTTGATLPPTPPLPPPVPQPAGSPPTTGSQPAGPSASATAPGSASGSASAAASGSVPGSAPGTAPFVAAPSGPGTGQTAGPAARLVGFDASRDRFTNRGKRRGATVLRFRLSRAARLVLVVRGPGPSCAIVARIAIRGHAGANRYRFNGRIDGRPLEPGTYLLTPRLRGRTADLARAYVTIVAPGAPTAARILPDCEPAEPARSFLEREEGTAATPLAAAPDDASPPPPDVGVRGEESPSFAALLPPRVFEDRDPLPLVLGLAVLGLLAVSLLGIVFEVVRHLRSPQV